MARPRKDQALDIPARAVEATITLLADHDVDAITMADVATAVGCRAPALYNHFANKTALLRAVHDAGFARLYEEKLAVAARTTGDALARLREGGLAYLRFALENPALYRLMFSPPRAAGLDGNPFADDIGLKSLAFLRASIEACQREGAIAGRDPDAIAFALWSLVHGAASLILQNRVPAATADPESLVQETIDTAMTILTTPSPSAPAKT